MSVFRFQGIECDNDTCKEEWEGHPSDGWRRMVAYARQAGWQVSNDGMTAYCPAHRTRRTTPSKEPD
jgi:hypothetical protein